jgi:hypothetical protein
MQKNQKTKTIFSRSNRACVKYDKGRGWAICNSKTTYSSGHHLVTLTDDAAARPISPSKPQVESRVEKRRLCVREKKTFVIIEGVNLASD